MLIKSNTPTGRLVKVTRTTGRGSDHYGACEICAQPMSECFAARYGRERTRPDGEIYTDKTGVSTYGHKACLSQLPHVKVDTLLLNHPDVT